MQSCRSTRGLHICGPHAGEKTSQSFKGVAEGGGCPSPEQVGQLLGSKGWVEALLRLVANAPDPALASEAAWVLTYLSAAEAGHLRRLAEAGAVNAVLERLLPATATRVHFNSQPLANPTPPLPSQAFK